MSSQRQEVIQQLATEIVALVQESHVAVGIDGVDGAGKTTLADELAAAIDAWPVIRASIDSFHRPKAARYARGRHSPEGYYLDSFDYDKVREVLLDPLRPGGSGEYRVAAFDYRSDSEVVPPVQQASSPSILIVDGIFLHRPELASYWDYSIFLEVSFAESVARNNRRAGEPSATNDPEDQRHRRYVQGQRLYLQTVEPRWIATRAVDNERLDAPRFL